jgi:hypothetical protein
MIHLVLCCEPCKINSEEVGVKDGLLRGTRGRGREKRLSYISTHQRGYKQRATTLNFDRKQRGEIKDDGHIERE